jgi:hemoglobin/transferrin/lactoferrin receptor protein
MLCALLCLSMMASAQIVTIKSQDALQPLEFATLRSERPSAAAVTNARGQADLAAFKGSEQIEIRLLGYETLTLSYTGLEAASFVVLLAPVGIGLDQVIVSASRWEQTQRESPAKVRAINQRQIALQNPQTAADLLGATGEVFVQKSQQGGGSPIIRGFAANRLLIAVDGVRMNTAIFRSGNLQNVISVDPFAIERAEVLFGPGSVSYGSDAIGGVMSFYTLAPQLSPDDRPFIKGKASARHASANGERTGHFDINLGWKKWAFVSSMSHHQFGDLRMGTRGPEEYLRREYVQRIDTLDRVVANDDPLVQRPSGYGQVNLMQKLYFKPSERLDFTYGFHYSATTAFSRYDRLLRYRANGLPFSAEWNYGPQIWMMNNLQLRHRTGKGLYDQLALTLARQDFGESRSDRSFNRQERRQQEERVAAYSANLDFNKALGSKSQLLYGLEFILNQVSSEGSVEDIRTGQRQAGAVRYPQADWSSYAAHLTYQWRPSEQLSLQAATRYNRFALEADFAGSFLDLPFERASLDQGALTGSLGGVFQPNSSWALNVNLSSGFRAPNVDDIGKVFDSEPGAVTVPNPNLKAEYAYNAEIGLDKIFGKALRLNLVAYYTWLDGALVRRNFQVNGQDSIFYGGELSRVQAIQNAARANVWGLQAGVEAKLPGGFSLTGQLNYQSGEEELDDGSRDPLRHAAPWFGMGRLAYAASKLRLELYSLFSGEVSYDNLALEERSKPFIYATDTNGQPYSPAWYTLNFKAIYQLSEQLSISSGVENLTDQRYRPYSSGLVAPGRNFILALSAAF